MPATAQSAGVVSFEQAQEIVREYSARVARPLTHDIALLNALGRVLAEPLGADRDFPPFPRATRDGYAVRSADLARVPVHLRVTGQIKAGAAFDRTVGSGEAVEIMTGAAVPSGADAVVMVEYTAPGESASEVEIQRAVTAGENVVPAGAEARAGQEVLSRGTRMTAAHVAMAAAAGKARIAVFMRPRVAVLSTGDELVDVSEQPGPSQIRNSNTYSLAAQIEEAGGEPMRLPIAKDNPAQLAELLQAGLNADLLLVSGGVSMGKFDLVEEVLKKMGATFFFTGVLIQPGRPVVFGEISFSRESNGSSEGRKPRDVVGTSAGERQLKRFGGTVPFFGLPGNPLSTMVCFDLFVRPVLDALSGANPERLPVVRARLKKEFKTKTGLTRFLPATLQGGVFDPEAEVVPWQGSGDLRASAKADCYLVVPPDRESLSAGEMVSILMRR